MKNVSWLFVILTCAETSVWQFFVAILETPGQVHGIFHDHVQKVWSPKSNKWGWTVSCLTEFRIPAGTHLYWKRPRDMTLTQKKSIRHKTVFQITASPSARSRQLWRRTGNFFKDFPQFFVHDLRFKAGGLTTFLTEFWTLHKIRLLGTSPWGITKTRFSRRPNVNSEDIHNVLRTPYGLVPKTSTF